MWGQPHLYLSYLRMRADQMQFYSCICKCKIAAFILHFCASEAKTKSFEMNKAKTIFKIVNEKTRSRLYIKLYNPICEFNQKLKQNRLK